MAALVDRMDAFQRRRPVLGFPVAVVYKFFDNQGTYLAATVTYYAFVAIFPLMLIASSVLGFVLQGNDALRQELLGSALHQFPIVGTQLGRAEGLQGSTTAVIVGALAASYGIFGLGQATQIAVNVAWSVPRNSQLNPFLSRLRTLLLLALGGVALLAVAVLSSLASHVDLFGSEGNRGVRLLLTAATVAVTALALALMMSLASLERHGLSITLPGAITVAVLWQLLQVVGGAYVSGVLSQVNEMNSVFALVLGLIALLYVGAVTGLIGLQVNVVRAKQLYPRALLTPFTDDVELTDADRRAYVDYAQAQRHKGFEKVHVTFDDQPDDQAHRGRRNRDGGV